MVVAGKDEPKAAPSASTTAVVASKDESKTAPGASGATFRCGACGAEGHKRNWKVCPLFEERKAKKCKAAPKEAAAAVAPSKDAPKTAPKMSTKEAAQEKQPAEGRARGAGESTAAANPAWKFGITNGRLQTVWHSEQNQGQPREPHAPRAGSSRAALKTIDRVTVFTHPPGPGPFPRKESATEEQLRHLVDAQRRRVADLNPDLTAIADASVVDSRHVGRASHILGTCPLSLADAPEPVDEYLTSCRDVYTCSYRQEAEAIIISMRRLLDRAAEARRTGKPLGTLALLSDSQGALAAVAKGPFRQREGHVAVTWDLLVRVAEEITGRIYLAFVYSHIGFAAHDRVDGLAGEACPDDGGTGPRVAACEHRNPIWWRDEARRRWTIAEAECDALAQDQFRFKWHRHVGVATIRTLRALSPPDQRCAVQLRCGVAPSFGGLRDHEADCSHCPATRLSRGAAVEHAFSCPAEEAKRQRDQLLVAGDGAADHSPRALWYNIAAAIKYWRWYTTGEASSPQSRASPAPS